MDQYWRYNEAPKINFTCFDTFSQVFLNLKIGELVNAVIITKTPLKLCIHLHASATAAHFSMTLALADEVGLVTISDATSLLI